MSAQLRELYLDIARGIEADRSARRIRLQQMIESMIVEFRPDYISAGEILAALKTALDARLEPDGGIPLEIEYAFDDLIRSLDAGMRAAFIPDAYDSIGMGHDDLPYEEKE